MGKFLSYWYGMTSKKDKACGMGRRIIRNEQLQGVKEVKPYISLSVGYGSVAFSQSLGNSRDEMLLCLTPPQLGDQG